MVDVQTLTARRDRNQFQAKALLDRASAEKRGLTSEEETEYADLLKALESDGKILTNHPSNDTVRKTLDAMTGWPGQRIIIAPGHGKSLGQQFVDSDAGKWLAETKSTRPGQWTSPGVELHATLLTEDPASGGGLVLPEYQPAIVPLPQRPLTVAQLFARGTTATNAIGFMRHKGYTNAAAPVLEGGVKPESAMLFELVTQALKKIAHWIPATDEILEDVPTLRSYIDAQLRLGVELTLDSQLLNGDGVGANLLGIMNTPGLAAPVAQATATALDAIAAQISAIQIATGLKPDGIVVNPNDWLFMQLAKTSTKEYLGTGPFAAPVAPTLWGVSVAVPPVMAAGTALVGAFGTAAQLFTKGGIRVDATNSHQDYFIKNLVAIRAEIRALLATYLPQAFGKVTGLTAPALMEFEDGGQGRLNGGERTRLGEGAGASQDEASDRAREKRR